jgi:hypothetical protein
VADDYNSEEARQARRNAHYDKLCWCGHALGNHTPITGDCMLCDHSQTADDIREHEARILRAKLTR